jgi:hypothetical protein
MAQGEVIARVARLGEPPPSEVLSQRLPGTKVAAQLPRTRVQRAGLDRGALALPGLWAKAAAS